MTSNRPMNLTGDDWFRDVATRLSALERRTGNMLTPDLLGPGIASMAVGIIDWNALEVTFNGFFYSNAGIAINSPDPELSWTGQTIAKDDGSGLQQVWNTDVDPIYWVRTYAPNPEPGGQPIFEPWKRFASGDGTIPTTLLSFTWEDGDAYTLTSEDVAEGGFTFTLTYIPHVESVHAAWGGVIQHPDEYVMNYNTALVTWPLAGYEQAGDVFWFHYTHDRVHSPTVPPEPDCTPLTGLVLRGAVWGGNLTTEIALPVGTQVGDLIVVTGHGNNDGGKNFPLGAGAMTDPRMTGYYGHPSGDDWWGTATDLSPVQIAIPALIGSGANAFAQVSTYGDSGGSSPLVVGTPVSVTKAEVYANGGDPIDVVALNSRAVVALCTYDHGSGSDTPDVPTGYTASDSGYSSHASTAAYWTGDPNSPSSTWTVISAYQRYDRTITLLPVMVEDCAEPAPTMCSVIDLFERASLSPGAFNSEDSTYLPWLLTTENVPAPHEGFHIVSGVLYPVANSAGEFLTIDTGNANGTYTVERYGGSITNSQDDRLAFRVSDDGTTGFQWTLDGTVIYFDVNVHVTTSGTPGIYNGGGESLATGVGDDLDVFEGEMKIVLDGNTMTFYQDDVEVGEVTDSRNNTATRFGFGTSDATPGTRGYSQIGFTCATAPPPEPVPCYVDLIDSFANPPLSHYRLGDTATGVLTDRVGGEHGTADTFGAVAGLLVGDPDGGHQPDTAATACQVTDSAYLNPTLTGFTLSCLVNLDSVTTGDVILVSRESGVIEWRLCLNDGKPRLQIRASSGTFYTATSTTVLTTATTYHITGKWEGGGLTVTANDSVVATVSTGAASAITDQAGAPLRIGSYGSTLQVAGTVDEVIIWGPSGPTTEELASLTECALTGSWEEPPDPTGPGPYETPLSSKAVHEGYGICQHVNFQTDNIHAGATNQAAIMARYGSMNVHQMRSLYVPNTSAAFTAAIDGLREHDMVWNATVATRQEDGSISPSEATIRTRIQKMASDHADVIAYIEGVNEPNHEEDPDWVANSLRAQWVIWDEWSQHPELAHVKILSPSMHDTRLDASDGAHWDEWANGSIVISGEGTFQGKDLCHMAAVHNYPGGSLPDTKRDERVQWVYDAFGEGFPVKLSEWGYTTALGEPRIGGHKVTNEAAAAAYAAQGILDHALAGYEVLQYEMMDDPNSGNNDTEKNFGQWKVTSLTGTPDTTWTAKPSVAAITTVLSALEDPGVAYIPHDVTLDTSDIPAGVRWLVTQKRNGDTTLWLWRHEEMWDPIDETPITVGTVSVPVTDVVGLRNITVGVMPVAVEVREA